MSSKITRRDFVKSTAAAGAAVALASTTPGCGTDETDTSAFDAVPFSQVTLVRAESPAEAVARGVALMGAFDFIEHGQTVMLKPNMTGPIAPPDVTSPAVLRALISECYAAGADEVIVAERTYYPLETTFTFDFPNYEGGISMREIIEDESATFRPLDNEPWDEVHPAGAVDFAEPLLVPRILTEVDHYVNVPALKTHEGAVFTMSMKNFFGLVHPDTRTGQVHDHPDNAADPDRQLRMFAQMNLAFDPVLNVMDAILSRTTGGPTPPGEVAETNMVLFGKDRVAMDAVGLAILKAYGTEPHIEDRPVWDQVQLAEAARLGLGASGPDEITLVAEGIDEIDDIDALLRET